MKKENYKFYILGDPYNRFNYCKVGITKNIKKRFNHIVTQCPRRQIYLPEGLSVHSLYSIPNREEALLIEKQILNKFSNRKADTRTLGWIKVKSGIVDVCFDVIVDKLGLEYEMNNFSYIRWC